MADAADDRRRRRRPAGDAPFLAVLAEEVEVEMPLSAATIDRMLEEPMPAYPPNDRLFLALARGLVEEAVAERGFPW